MLKIYSVFHLNTSFSSIEKEKIPALIKYCYWPLINIIEKNDFKIAIECSGKTIQDIHTYDSRWINKLKKLIKLKKCEFIGSGYRQIISPIVPEEVTKKNIIFGNMIYKKLLSYIPDIALINEQAFSKSLIKIYKKHYKAIIFDWINAQKASNSYFPPEPCFVSDDYKNKIPVIWANSIAFQKFQRLITGEIDYKNYQSYLNKNKKNKFLCIYSNDAEIFNFRPKRFSAEINLNINEWEKIEKIYNFFKEDKKKYKFYKFSQLLKEVNKKNIIFSSAETPIIVKKQKKYNINRWAICGKNNLLLNTICWKIYYTLKKRKKVENIYWLDLCDLWSSDLRTHMTKKKSANYIKKINLILKKLNIKKNDYKINLKDFKKVNKLDVNVKHENNFIKFFNKNFSVIFNTKKGLTVDSFIDKKISNKSLFGTIYQGHINQLDSDYYSGHFDLFRNDISKITDLTIMDKKFNIFKNKKNKYLLLLQNKFPSGELIKKFIFIDMKKRELEIIFNFKNISPTILRMFNITINPDSFNKKSLYIKTNNGSNDYEKFKFNKDFNHGKIVQDVSKFTSSNNSFQITNSKLLLGDNIKSLKFQTDKNLSSLISMINFKNFKEKFFLRTFFSAQESDDTFPKVKNMSLFANLKINAIKN